MILTKTRLFFLIFLSLNLSSTTPLFGQEAAQYLSDEQIEKLKLVVPPPPIPGSHEFNKDFEILHSFEKTRLEFQCKFADLEAPLNAPQPFVEPAGPLTLEEFNNWKSFSDQIYLSVSRVLDGVKNKYKRARPYITDQTLKPCVALKDSNSYPSGHATMGELFGRILAKAYPKRRAMFLKRGKQYGVDRYLGGVHHPSDVKAGQSLGDQIFAELMRSSEFKKKLKELSSLSHDPNVN